MLSSTTVARTVSKLGNIDKESIVQDGGQNKLVPEPGPADGTTRVEPQATCLGIGPA